MTDKKTIPFRITEQEYRMLKQRALEKEVSVNQYLKNLLIKDSPLLSCNDESKELRAATIRVRLSSQDMMLLTEKAASMGMSISEFIRDIIHKKAYVHLSVGISDLHELLDSINILSRKLNGAIAVLRSAGEIYETDVQTIIKIFKDIDDTCNRIYLEERQERYRLYEEARRNLFEDISFSKERKAKAIPRKRAKS